MLTRQKKEEIVKNLKEKISQMKSFVLIDYTGMKVAEMARLRRDLKKDDAELKVTKRRLLNIALKESDLNINPLFFKGQMAIVFGYGDEIAPAKILNSYIRAGKPIKILAGLIGDRYFNDKEVISLARLPGKEELLAKLVDTVFAPLSGLINVLQGNIRGLVNVLSKIKK